MRSYSELHTKGVLSPPTGRGEKMHKRNINSTQAVLFTTIGKNDRTVHFLHIKNVWVLLVILSLRCRPTYPVHLRLNSKSLTMSRYHISHTNPMLLKSLRGSERIRYRMNTKMLLLWAPKQTPSVIFDLSALLTTFT